MDIRLEGTPQETAEGLATIMSLFNAKKPSKFYPNARGSLTNSAGRVYVTIDGPMKAGLVETLTNDLLSLAAKYGRLGEGSDSMAEMIRQFYDAGQRGLKFEKLFSLYAVLRDRIILTREDNKN